jgi:hypothetical protein
MQSQNIIRLKTPVNLNNNYNLENKDTFELNKKPKNIFREYSNIANKKNYYFPKSSIYRSFINSSAPFNYCKNPADKNTFLVSYNGGPQKQLYSFIKREDLKNDFYDKKIVYRNFKPCGCTSKYYMPKLARSQSYNDFRYNDINMDNNQCNQSNNLNNFNKINFPSSYGNTGYFKRYMTPNHFRMSKDGKIILTLKKFRNDELKNNLRYENQKNTENNEKSRNTFYSSFYSFRPRISNYFHKTQIFNRCKPFLVDQFQEFPD